MNKNNIGKIIINKNNKHYTKKNNEKWMKIEKNKKQLGKHEK